MNRKGVSAVIATVLLILITIAAVTIIWAVVLPMIQGITDVSCVNVIQDVSVLDRGYTCYNESGDNVKIQISRGSKDYDLRNLQVSISAGGNSKSYYVLDNTTTITPDDHNLGLNLTHLPGINTERVYVLDWDASVDGKPDKVAVAPIVRAEGSSKDKTCDSSSELTLGPCQ